MNENDVLGFDPTQLTVFDENAPKSMGNSNIYRTRPIDSKSKDHVYRATIKVIYNPFDLRQSVLEQQSYAMQDENGFFSIVSALTVGDKNCPVFKAWKKCHFAEKGSALWKQAARKDEGGNELFDKRFTRYAVIQVLSDKNQEELEGKYMLWKMPKSVWDIINSKINPAKETGKAKIPVMDFLFGRSIDLEVIPGADDPNDVNYRRKTSYMCEISDDTVSCTAPDGSPILNTDEQKVLDTYIDAMKPIWKSKNAEEREEMLATVNADPNTKQLREIYNNVLAQIKNWCPNLIEELGYHELTPEVSARVQKWIDTVLSGNNPAVSVPSAIDATATSTNNVTVPTDNVVPSAPAASTDADDDDLPF